jgi:Malectin domain
MRPLVCLGLCLAVAVSLSACGTNNFSAPTTPELTPTTMQSVVSGESATVVLDIKPRVSPNKIRHMGRGRLRAAIVGTAEFDVRDVDVSTVTLEGVRPKRASYRDITSPAGCTNNVTNYRVNCGGPVLSAEGEDWMEDSEANRSPWVNTGFAAVATETVSTSHPSLPAGTPMELLQAERWDWTSSPEMLWDFPVSDGDYVVRLYFSENYVHNQAPGKRMFDVTIEGELVLDDYDVFADVGGYTGVMKEFHTSVADGELTLNFIHVLENPMIAAIEILSATGEVAKVRSVQDGVEDLLLRFSKRQLRRAIGKMAVGEERVLTIEGQLLDGTPFTGTDVIIRASRGRRHR